MKLLLDENISPKVAEELARVDGLDACHVRDRGLLAATDAEVLERAYDEDRVLVTANVGDFLRLARARDLHPGIVLLEDGASPRAEQLRLLRVAAAAIAQLASFSTRSSGLPLTARCARGHPSALRQSVLRAWCRSRLEGHHAEDRGDVPLVVDLARELRRVLAKGAPHVVRAEPLVGLTPKVHVGIEDDRRSDRGRGSDDGR